MFSDIIGYTRVMQKDELLGRSRVRRYRDVLDLEVGKHEGEVMQHYGDGSLTIFESAVQAVQCAIAIQSALADSPAVPLRIGIHLGDIVIDRGDIYGDSVNIASRFESLGINRSIMVSAPVVRELVSHPELKTTRLGSFYLKNVKKPRLVFAVRGERLLVPTVAEVMANPHVLKQKGTKRKKFKYYSIGVILSVVLLLVLDYSFSYMIFSARNDPSIAVLPFADLSQEGDHEWFCDGMMEQIISDLVKIQQLKVIARTSSLKYKKTSKTIPEIGEELGVNHILEGSVRTNDDKVRISAQLVKVANGFHVWEQVYEKDFSDFFDVQDDVSSAIAGALHVEMIEEQPRIRLRSANQDEDAKTKDLEAIKLYQLARYHYEQYDSWASREFQTGLDLYDRCIAANPEFIDAYIGKANLLLAIAWRRHVEPGLIKAQIIDCVENASRIDPSSGLVHEVLGRLAWLYEHDFNLARRHYQMAIQFAPGYDVTYGSYAWLLYVNGHFEQAKEIQREAINLNPLNSGYHGVLAEIYLIEEKFDSALSQYQSNLDLFPDDVYSTWGLACTRGFRGEYDEAIQMINSIPGYEDNNFATAYFAAEKGDTAYARSILNVQKKRHHIIPYEWKWTTAVIHTALGEHDQAIDLLEETPHDLMYCALWFRPLRKDLRFRSILEEYGFDPSKFPN